MRLATVLLVWLLLGDSAVAGPVIFWAPDQAAPGDVVLLYGGGLSKSKKVQVQRLPDTDPGQPGVRTPETPPDEATAASVIRSSDNCVQFLLPETFQRGIFEFAVETPDGKSTLRRLNVPELWFMQPTSLRPGLRVNQSPPGAEIQLVGKNLLLHDDLAAKTKAVLRPVDKGRAFSVDVSHVEPFSLIAHLPDSISPGNYELLVHDGHGGPKGWSEPLAVEIKAGDVWPVKIFNVRDFGAKGDDVTDDTNAIRDALAAAEKNSGGVVYLPWGTYRLSDWILVPERTIMRGEVRDASVLKWPIDPPSSEKDFVKAGVYIGSKCGLENLTLTARKVEVIVLDVQTELNSSKTVPPEVVSRIRPFGQGGDIFFRRVTFQHLLLAGRPEQQKPVMENPALNKRYWEGLRNLQIYDGPNVEISDCAFQGADQQFGNLRNGRIVRNSFANSMGYAWTALGSGAHDVVCEGNEIRCSSSWGWGWIGLQRVYSAHNASYNFVRGEREAMTLDISATPSARPVSQYWGTPIEVGGGNDKPFLRFPPASETDADGFRTGWTPGCFRGGTVFIRAFQGGAGGGQSRQILDNTADSILLDKPFQTSPETTYHPLYLEIAPRHNRAHIGTTAWMGTLAKSAAATFTAKDANWIPREFSGMTALVMDGRGAGQYRVIADNSASDATLEKPWDIVPDETSAIGIWSLMRHMIVYDCQGYDSSAFAQLYGPFLDYTVEGCRVERGQGIWGQMGWFTQFRRNSISYAFAYHPGIGMHGPNPEKNAPFGYSGLDNNRIRLTKSGALQYPDRKMPLFADEILPHPIPSTLAHIQRDNVFRYGQRMVIQPWSGDSAPGPRPGGAYFRDVLFDRNCVENSPVGMMVGPNVEGAVLSGNRFHDVGRPLWLAKPDNVIQFAPPKTGTALFSSGDLTGWVEEQHDFYQKKHPNVKTWSIKDGVVACDGSTGNCGFLRFDKELGDFTLKLEYRLSTDCNSGVCIRSPHPYNGRPETLPSHSGYEIQLLDDAGQLCSDTSTGALYGTVPPCENANRPAGEWNQMEVICRGSKLRVNINGRMVQDLDQTTLPAIKDRPQRGYLLLQNHGYNAQFRDVWLNEVAETK